MSLPKRMKSNGFDNELVICASNKFVQHILNEPRPLSCGHNICENCIPPIDEIPCNLCKKINKYSLNDGATSLIGAKYLQEHFDDLFESLKSQSAHIENEAKKSLLTAKTILNSQFDNVKQEVERRVESLKKELDKFHETFKNELEKKKYEFIRVVNECEFTVKTHAQNINTIYSTQTSSTMEPDLKNVYKFDEILTKLKQLIENTKKINIKVEFIKSKIEISRDLIGKVKYDDDEPMFFEMKKSIYKTFDTTKMINSIKPSNFCVLLDKQLLVSSFSPGGFKLYDEKFTLKRSVDKINETLIKPRSIASNNKNNIYFTSHDKHDVSLVDFGFSQLKFVGNQGNGPNQFNCPTGICFYSNFLYVCDTQNKRIQILNEDLDFKSNQTLDLCPVQIQIVKNVACICDKQNSVYFFKVKEKFENFGRLHGHEHYGPICSTNNYFYQFHYPTKKLYCYNKDGLLHKQTELLFKNDIVFDEYDSIIVFKDEFIFSNRKEKTLILLSL